MTLSIPGCAVPVAPICLGTAEYGSQLSQEVAFAQLDSFVELGGTMLDSAHVYGAWDAQGINGGCGNSEVVIGRWLKARGCRERIILATKGGHPDFATGESRLTELSLRQQLAESLGHLEIGTIDVYWLHRDDRTVPVEDIFSWLAGPVGDGRIRSVGCSHWRTDRLEEARMVAARLKIPLFGSQIAWSLAQPNEFRSAGRYGEQLAMDAETLAWHHSGGLPVAAYNSQAAGFFAAKYDEVDFVAPDFPKPGLVKRYGSALNFRRRAVARTLAGQRGCSTNQIALAWLLRQGFPTLAIIGPHSEDQLRDSMAAMTIRLDDRELAALTGTQA